MVYLKIFINLSRICYGVSPLAMHKNHIMKHLLLLPALLLFSLTSVAQLYVSPNDNATPGDPSDDTDSYVYVNNQILYVEQGINLVENNVNADTEASIYLRNGSQLMQGGTTSTNAGSGYISVKRENPGSDAWDYTYYASPVGDNLTPASTPSPGNITFGINSLHTADYGGSATVDYDNPVSLTRGLQTNTTTAREGNFDVTTDNLVISTRWTYTRGVGTGANWVRIYANNVVPPAQGWIMKGVNRNGAPSTHNFVYDFRGRPNNGTFTFNTIPVTGLDKQEVFTGNPYPSALDLNRLFYDTQAGEANGTDNRNNSEIEAILYVDENRSVNSHLYTANKAGIGVWVPGASNPDGTNPGTYTVPPFFNYDSAGNPTTPTGNSGAPYERRFAPIGQGFYFRTANTLAGDGTNNQVFIKNQYRRYVQEGASSEFRTPSGPIAQTTAADPGPNTEPANEQSFIRLYTYFDESHFRDMVLSFDETSTDYFDRGRDGRHPMDAAFADAYFPVKLSSDPSDEAVDKFVIQSVPFNIERKVPYVIKLNQQMNVVVQAVQKVNVTAEAFLWDAQENTYQQITGDHTASMLLNAGEYKDRFYIVFKGGNYPILSDAQRTTEDGNTISEVRQNVIFVQNNRLGQLEVSNPETYDIQYAHMFDMTGKLVQTRAGIGRVSGFTMNTSSLSDGVYLVKLVTADNISVDYKALVHNRI